MCCSKTYRRSQNCKSTVVLTVQTREHETVFQKACNSMNKERRPTALFVCYFIKI